MKKLLSLFIVCILLAMPVISFGQFAEMSPENKGIIDKCPIRSIVSDDGITYKQRVGYSYTKHINPRPVTVGYDIPLHNTDHEKFIVRTESYFNCYQMPISENIYGKKFFPGRIFLPGLGLGLILLIGLIYIASSYYISQKTDQSSS